jgi:hypothetical protein
MSKENRIYLLVFVMGSSVILGLMTVFKAQEKFRSRHNAAAEHMVDSMLKSETYSRVYKGSQYDSIRRLELSEKPGSQVPGSKTIVYKVVIDWNPGDSIRTIVARRDGTGILLVNTGGYYTAQYKYVGNETKGIVDSAQKVLPFAQRLDSITLPDSGMVRCYLLTNKGQYYAEEQLKNLKTKANPFTNLMYGGYDLISEYEKGKEHFLDTEPMPK